MAPVSRSLTSRVASSRERRPHGVVNPVTRSVGVPMDRAVGPGLDAVVVDGVVLDGGALVDGAGLLAGAEVAGLPPGVWEVGAEAVWLGS
ncbi:Uncharacterised protein [Mycobacteroides abscessus subsp. abscessus]|nr:Uncharacterised protein [Mycobacteroides abscessus subsp. abscessus]